MAITIMMVGAVAIAYIFGFCIGWKGGNVNGYNRCLDDIHRSAMEEERK